MTWWKWQNKIYPEVKTEQWLAFYFSHRGNSYLIKLAWKPMFIIEELYNQLWWENFLEKYKLAKTNPELLSKDDSDKLKTAIEWAKTICNLFAAIGERGKSPFVVYINKKA